MRSVLHVQDEIQHEETTANIKYLFVDCGPLKQTLTAHCELWKAKLTGLLNNLAAAELRSLHEYYRCAGCTKTLWKLAAAHSYSSFMQCRIATMLHGNAAHNTNVIAKFAPLV